MSRRVNQDQFLEEGYVILRHVIPPEMLDAVCTACEKMIDRQRPPLAASGKLKRPDFAALPAHDQRYATSMHPMTLQVGAAYCRPFLSSGSRAVDALQTRGRRSASSRAARGARFPRRGDGDPPTSASNALPLVGMLRIRRHSSVPRLAYPSALPLAA